MTTTESQITAWLATQRDAMVALLREMVDIDSGSYNKPGIDAVGAVVQRFMAAQDIPVETLRQQKHGDCLRAAVPWDGPQGNAGGNIVLMGHRDTVFPDGEVSRRPFTIRDGVAYGPGVADMKAGLVMNCFVLAAFAKFGGSPAPLLGLFTGDEEIGSPEGRAVIEAEARRARVVFNSEPGRVSGNVVTGRKGGVFIGIPRHRQGGAFGRQLHRGDQRDRGTCAQGPGAACADRSRARHHGEYRSGAAAGRASIRLRHGRKARSTCAMWSRRIGTMRWRASARSSSAASCRGRRRN